MATAPTIIEVPIKVNQSSGQPAAVTLIRNILIAMLPVAVAKGWIPVDFDAEGLVTGIITAGLVVYGAVRSFRSNEQKKTMEPFVPNEIAVKK